MHSKLRLLYIAYDEIVPTFDTYVILQLKNVTSHTKKNNVGLEEFLLREHFA